MVACFPNHCFTWSSAQTELKLGHHWPTKLHQLLQQIPEINSINALAAASRVQVLNCCISTNAKIAPSTAKAACDAATLKSNKLVPHFPGLWCITKSERAMQWSLSFHLTASAAASVRVFAVSGLQVDNRKSVIGCNSIRGTNSVPAMTKCSITWLAFLRLVWRRTTRFHIAAVPYHYHFVLVIVYLLSSCTRCRYKSVALTATIFIVLVSVRWLLLLWSVMTFYTMVSSSSSFHNCLPSVAWALYYLLLILFRKWFSCWLSSLKPMPKTGQK